MNSKKFLLKILCLITIDNTLADIFSTPELFNLASLSKYSLFSDYSNGLQIGQENLKTFFNSSQIHYHAWPSNFTEEIHPFFADIYKYQKLSGPNEIFK
ncbi:hypothetical protein Avbf_18571 [Armadillidium vulgare]|nr:hypothetical protein Avbf_18571 [Armadillidium vulgare]